MEDTLILALDDDEDILRVVCAALESEGYEVKTATSRAGFEAVLQDNDPDVYLLDVRLPDGNGIQIARDLRTRTEAGIILVTGQNETIDRILGLELGADDYISKPFNVRELRARINAVYRRTAPIRRLKKVDSAADIPGQAATVRKFDGLTIDLAARRVTDGTGNEIDLTTLEFELLAVLSAQINRVLSRDQIMDSIRGPDWAAYDRTVDGLISRLRKKLFPDGSGSRKIRTVRGVGYMLSPTA